MTSGPCLAAFTGRYRYHVQRADRTPCPWCLPPGSAALRLVTGRLFEAEPRWWAKTPWQQMLADIDERRGAISRGYDAGGILPTGLTSVNTPVPVWVPRKPRWWQRGPFRSRDR